MGIGTRGGLEGGRVVARAGISWREGTGDVFVAGGEGGMKVGGGEGMVWEVVDVDVGEKEMEREGELLRVEGVARLGCGGGGVRVWSWGNEMVESSGDDLVVGA